MKKRMGIGLLLVLVLISAATGCTAVWDTGATEDKKQSGAPPAEEPVVLHVYNTIDVYKRQRQNWQKRAWMCVLSACPAWTCSRSSLRITRRRSFQRQFAREWR